MRKDLFQELLEKYLDGTASLPERQLVEAYYDRMAGMEGPDAEREGADSPVIRLRPWWLKARVWMPAAMLMLIAAGTYFWSYYRKEKSVAHGAGIYPVLQGDIRPGGDRAVLTLAGGRQIALDTSRNGAISSQGGMQVVKQSDGKLAYSPGGGPAGTDIQYNILSTPRGGRYRIVLSDGSTVWLNASSSVRYPTAFTGKQRVVDITGEAYLEVARDVARPFIVRVGGMEVQVLGTEFNVMAYAEEGDCLTTLVNGSVLVRGRNAGGGQVTQRLEPGQQARYAPSGDLGRNDDPDLEETLAWKSDLFSFNNTDIHAVMRELSRWYDVDIRYEGDVRQHFNGNISRTVNVSKVFQMLELTGGVHFRIEGKLIVVSP